MNPINVNIIWPSSDCDPYLLEAFALVIQDLAKEWHQSVAETVILIEAHNADITDQTKKAHVEVELSVFDNKQVRIYLNHFYYKNGERVSFLNEVGYALLIKESPRATFVRLCFEKLNKLITDNYNE